MVALYTTSLLMHLFCSGHVSLFLQLQLVVLVTCGWLFLIMRVLCFEIMFLTLFMQLKLTLTVFRLKILCNLWPAGKCVSTRSRKLRAMFVLMFLLNGGLNQMILRCLLPMPHVTHQSRRNRQRNIIWFNPPFSKIMIYIMIQSVVKIKFIVYKECSISYIR